MGMKERARREQAITLFLVLPLRPSSEFLVAAGSRAMVLLLRTRSRRFSTAERTETAEFFFRFLCELRGLCGKTFGCGDEVN
jgi:hypothetical protein